MVVRSQPPLNLTSGPSPVRLCRSPLIPSSFQLQRPAAADRGSNIKVKLLPMLLRGLIHGNFLSSASFTLCTSPPPEHSLDGTVEPATARAHTRQDRWWSSCSPSLGQSHTPCRRGRSLSPRQPGGRSLTARPLSGAEPGQGRTPHESSAASLPRK
jgi:hypothetical protein